MHTHKYVCIFFTCMFNIVIQAFTTNITRVGKSRALGQALLRVALVQFRNL